MTTNMSVAVGDSEPPLLVDTIGDNFDAMARRYPDRPALIDHESGREWDYARLGADIEVVAAGLIARGIRRGDRVGIWAPSSPEWLMVQYATAKIGAILVPINPAYRATELEFVLNHAGISLIVSALTFKTSDYGSMLGSVLPHTPSVTGIVFLETGEWDSLIDEGRAALRADADAVMRVQNTLSADDAVNIQYTSGTTGSPKGATLSHRSILNNGHSIGRLLGYTERERVCVPVPFHHCFGMVIGNLAATSHGAAIVIPARSFHARATLQAMSDHSCTVVMGVPTMFIAQLADEEFDTFDLSSLRVALMGGAPCPIEVMKETMRRMRVRETSVCYGMTETSPISMLTRRHDSMEKRVATVGRPMPHLEVKIVDPETGETAEIGIAGEFCTRGYSVMKGYWGDRARTDEVIDADGWMHSGDVGVMDSDGYVSITGRIKDMVIRGGENIYPREIEELLYTHPDVLDAHVIGVPDATMGEELMVWIKMKPGTAALDAITLREFCTGKLAHFKIPRYVRIVDDFPMTVTGKIRKVDMREQSMGLIEPT